jgi:hypothetical protein
VDVAAQALNLHTIVSQLVHNALLSFIKQPSRLTDPLKLQKTPMQIGGGGLAIRESLLGNRESGRGASGNIIGRRDARRSVDWPDVARLLNGRNLATGRLHRSLVLSQLANNDGLKSVVSAGGRCAAQL